MTLPWPPVRNLVVICNQDMSLNVHIKQIRRTAFIHLLCTVKMGNILSQTNAKMLVHAFITSRIIVINFCHVVLKVP